MLRGSGRLVSFFLGHRADEIAKVDTTGGTAEVIRLDDSHVRKVLLRFVKSGVSVEMVLTPAEAEDFVAELRDALRWTKERS